MDSMEVDLADGWGYGDEFEAAVRLIAIEPITTPDLPMDVFVNGLIVMARKILAESTLDADRQILEEIKNSVEDDVIP